MTMIFRQLFDPDTSTYTYLLADETTREAVIIDPVQEQFERDAALIQELELRLVAVLDTHVHADHVTAQGLLRQRFGAKSVMSERSGAVCADALVKQGDRVTFGRHTLEVRETPGHTNGCLTFVCHEPRMAFTGDALLIRGCGRTDFQGGDSRALYQSVRERVFALPDDTAIYPAHDYKGRTVSTVAEEKRYNPRLGMGRSLSEFTQLMAALKLPYPRKMDVSVPANLACGLPAPALPHESASNGWAPISVSPAGVPELDAEWVAANGPRVATLIDVREPDEFHGALGHVHGAELMPLATLVARVSSLPRETPIVTICRSGGRSGKAALALHALGFPHVASLRGGMLGWAERKLPIEYGWPSPRADQQG
jgi:glyoxylase-like metal-dependent hydrolase (beta-lactamase superfamily II)/rhodanese-related sulfurtransferase